MDTKGKQGEICGALWCENRPAVCLNRHRKFYVCLCCAEKINRNQKEGDEPHCGEAVKDSEYRQK